MSSGFATVIIPPAPVVLPLPMAPKTCTPLQASRRVKNVCRPSFSSGASKSFTKGGESLTSLKAPEPLGSGLHGFDFRLGHLPMNWKTRSTVDFVFMGMLLFHVLKAWAGFTRFRPLRAVMAALCHRAAIPGFFDHLFAYIRDGIAEPVEKLISKGFPWHGLVPPFLVNRRAGCPRRESAPLAVIVGFEHLHVRVELHSADALGDAKCSQRCVEERSFKFIQSLGRPGLHRFFKHPHGLGALHPDELANLVALFKLPRHRRNGLNRLPK